MNWKQLKDFCNNLPESELEKNVMLWREDESINKIEAEQLSEDHYIAVGQEENGCFPVSESKDLEADIKIKRVYKKGQPLLHEIF
jgi:AmiR/NasT family two-component response regulator